MSPSAPLMPERLRELAVHLRHRMEVLLSLVEMQRVRIRQLAEEVARRAGAAIHRRPPIKRSGRSLRLSRRS
ncbi:MAG TPA: hypothetical protein VLH79_08155 [Chthonomonadales bacterium]|nr:hypothetical protein [Chthonomonadales bacterium]